MSATMKINARGQIKIPKNIMQSLNIGPGDYIEIDLESGKAIMKPRKLIDPSQSWYWTPDWQVTEVKVDEEVDNNQVSQTFYSAEEGLKWLKE